MIRANCSQWLRSNDGNHDRCRKPSDIAAKRTGAVSTAPTITRRVRSAISALRSASSLFAASAGRAACPPFDDAAVTGRAGRAAMALSDADAGSTTRVP